MKNLFLVGLFIFVSVSLSTFKTHADTSVDPVQSNPSKETTQVETPVKKEISANWKKLVETVLKSGKVVSNSFNDYLFIENIQPQDQSQSHTANYFSLVGYIADGVIHADRIEVVSENWQLDIEGNWNIDQWLFKVSEAGEVTWSAHIGMVQTPKRIITKHEYYEYNKDEEALNWKRVLGGWYNHIGLEK